MAAVGVDCGVAWALLLLGGGLLMRHVDMCPQLRCRYLAGIQTQLNGFFFLTADRAIAVRECPTALGFIRNRETINCPRLSEC